MSTINKSRENTWRVQIRRKGRYASQTFRLKSLADEWARDIESLIDKGGEPYTPQVGKAKTISDLVDLHLLDLQEVGKPLGRSKRAVLESLKRNLGLLRIKNLDRATLIQYGRQRAKDGAGPVTLSVDLSYLNTVLTHAAAIHGIRVNTECVRLARIALTRLGLIGRSFERDRRPSQSEIDALIEYFNSHPTIIPMARVMASRMTSILNVAPIAFVSANVLPSKEPSG